MLLALQPNTDLFRATLAQLLYKRIFSGKFTIFTVCSLRFSAVIGDNVDICINVHRAVWAMNHVVLYWGLSENNFKIFSAYILHCCLLVSEKS
jgi:hypothetical protein